MTLTGEVFLHRSAIRQPEPINSDSGNVKEGGWNDSGSRLAQSQGISALDQNVATYRKLVGHGNPLNALIGSF